jgi:hypothetical protein
MVLQLADFLAFIKPIYREANDGKAFVGFAKWFLLSDPEWSTRVVKVGCGMNSQISGVR